MLLERLIYLVQSGRLTIEQVPEQYRTQVESEVAE